MTPTASQHPGEGREDGPRRFTATIPMPKGARCPRCKHPSKGHSVGTCLVKVGRQYKGPEGETVVPVCGCGYWQGPRPWLGEGPAWAASVARGGTGMGAVTPSYNDCDCVPGHRCDCWDHRAATPAPREGDWEELRRLAEAATPGPWEFTIEGRDAVVLSRDKDADAAFAAAASPNVVLSLIAELRAARTTEQAEPRPAASRTTASPCPDCGHPRGLHGGPCSFLVALPSAKTCGCTRPWGNWQIGAAALSQPVIPSDR